MPSEGNRHLSCCAIVRDMQRCVYFVPTPGSVPASNDPELVALEAAAAADPSAKGPLFKRLHVRFGSIHSTGHSSSGGRGPGEWREGRARWTGEEGW